MLLKQRVDFFGMFITENKIRIILAFRFSKNLKDLEIFFDMIKWLRTFIFRYV